MADSSRFGLSRLSKWTRFTWLMVIKWTIFMLRTANLKQLLVEEVVGRYEFVHTFLVMRWVVYLSVLSLSRWHRRLGLSAQERNFEMTTE